MGAVEEGAAEAAVADEVDEGAVEARAMGVRRGRVMMARPATARRPRLTNKHSFSFLYKSVDVQWGFYFILKKVIFTFMIFCSSKGEKNKINKGNVKG